MTVELDPEGTVADVPGFQAHGVHAGLKYKDPDVALLASGQPCAAAGCFTTNEFAAPPVHVTREHLETGAQAIVCNSAIANACTGSQGYDDAEAMAQLAGDALGLPPEQVLVASTGLIGDPLPMDKVEQGIQAAADGLANPDPHAAAEAITTTDTHTKHTACTLAAGERRFTVGALAKGSGMIHPNMATMLSFVATDAPIAQEDLQSLVADAVDETFNMITVDGDESTNDMVLVLANGAEGGPALEPGSAGYEAFREGLLAVFDRMAREIAADGEGATSLLAVDVDGAATLSDAREGARAIAASNLVKAAVHGEDPNWGRIVAALGATEARVDPERITLTLEGDGHAAELVTAGRPARNGAHEEAEQALAADEVTVHVDLGLGPHQARAYGCDLSHEYVTVNAAYTT